MARGIGELVEPRGFVREGRLGPAFEVRLSRVVVGEDELFSDPRDFFRMTVPTKGMVEACERVLEGLVGEGEGTVVLWTRFGGGKTHVLATLWHLVESPGVALEEFVPAVERYLGGDRAGRLERLLERLEGLEGRVVVIDGMNLSKVLPRWAGEARDVKAPHLAWAAGLGREVYEEWVERFSGESGAGRVDRGDVEEALERVLEECDFVLTLVDEAPALLVGVSKRVRDGFVKFFQVLHDATQEVRGAGLALSIPDEGVYRDYARELDVRVTREDVREASESLAGPLRRTAEVGDPVSDPGEFLEIARRRLFERVEGPPEDLVARFRARLRELLGDEEEARRWARRLEETWPFHPALVDLLWGKLSEVEGFQRTRGALRALAAVTRWALERDPGAPWVGPEHACLEDEKVREYLVEQAVRLPDGWLSDVERRAREVRGEVSGEVDPVEVARVILLHSLPREARGARKRDVLVAVARPDREFTRADVETVLDRFREVLWYYHVEDGRYLFKEERNATALIMEAREEVGGRAARRVLREFLYLDREERGRARERWSELGVDVSPELGALEREECVRVLVWPDREEVGRVAAEGPVLVVLDGERDPEDVLPEGFEFPNAVAFLVPDEDALEDALEEARWLEAIRVAFGWDEAEGLEGELRERAREHAERLRARIRRAYGRLLLPERGGGWREVSVTVSGGTLGEAVLEELPVREGVAPRYLASRIVVDVMEAREVYREFLRRPGEGWVSPSGVKRALQEAVRRGWLAARRGDRVYYLEECPLDLDGEWVVGPPGELEPSVEWVLERVEGVLEEGGARVDELLEALLEGADEGARETAERVVARALARAVKRGELVAVVDGERVKVDPEELLERSEEIVIRRPGEEERGRRPVSPGEVLSEVRREGEVEFGELVKMLGGEKEVDVDSVRSAVRRLEESGEVEVEGDLESDDAVVRVLGEVEEIRRTLTSPEDVEELVREVRERLGDSVSGRVTACLDGPVQVSPPEEGVSEAAVYAFTDDGSVDVTIKLSDDRVSLVGQALRAARALRVDEIHLDLELEGVEIEGLGRLLESLLRRGGVEVEVELRPG